MDANIQTALFIVLIVVSSLVALLAISIVILLIVLLVKRNKQKSNDDNKQINDMKEIGGLSKQMEMIPSQIKSQLEVSISEQMIKLNENNNAKLERFQVNITETLAKRFDALNTQVDTKLAEINKKVDEKLAEGFKNTNESVTLVRERLQAIDDAQKNLENLSKDVVSLKNVLEGNQSRGQYGEYQLSMVLHNVFGDTVGCYEEQYTMKHTKDGDDVRADAVVFMPEPNKMICIDSKFPFAEYAKVFEAESDQEKEKLIKEFSNDVKKHITVIKDKYIVDGKTAPEALMFIPNDGVFAFIHHDCPDVVEYARSKKVILTSPSTLPAILVTINMVRIEVERAKNVNEISKSLSKLGQEFKGFSSEWDKFSSQLERATRSREELDHRVGKITNKFDALKNSESFNQIEEDSSNNIEIVEK